MSDHALAPLDIWHLTPESFAHSYSMLVCIEEQIDNPDNFENQDAPDYD